MAALQGVGLTVATVLAPVLLLIAIGYLWNKQSVPFERTFASRLSLDVGAPCLVVATLGTMDLPRQAIGDIFVAALAAYGLVAILAVMIFIAIFRQSLERLPLLLFGNTANLGLPICLYAVGQSGFALGTIVFAVSLVLQNLITPVLMGGAGAWRSILRTPVVHAAVIGVGLVFLDLALPGWLADSLKLVGQLTIPLMLISLGNTLSSLPSRPSAGAVSFSLGRMGLGFASAIAVIFAFDIRGEVASVLVLQMAMPAAVYSFAIAEKFNADTGHAAQVVGTSTLLAIPLLPLLVAIALLF